MIRERETLAIPGWPAFWLLLGLDIASGYTAVHAFRHEAVGFGLVWVFLCLVASFCLARAFRVSMNALYPAGVVSMPSQSSDSGLPNAAANSSARVEGYDAAGLNSGSCVLQSASCTPLR